MNLPSKPFGSSPCLLPAERSSLVPEKEQHDSNDWDFSSAFVLVCIRPLHHSQSMWKPLAVYRKSLLKPQNTTIAIEKKKGFLYNPDVTLSPLKLF